MLSDLPLQHCCDALGDEEKTLEHWQNKQRGKLAKSKTDTLRVLDTGCSKDKKRISMPELIYSI